MVAILVQFANPSFDDFIYQLQCILFVFELSNGLHGNCCSFICMPQFILLNCVWRDVNKHGDGVDKKRPWRQVTNWRETRFDKDKYHSLDVTCAASAATDSVNLIKGAIPERTCFVNHTHRNSATHTMNARFNHDR